ncbi:MAG: AAA family ATPase [Myxococcota bacterium]
MPRPSRDVQDNLRHAVSLRRIRAGCRSSSLSASRSEHPPPAARLRAARYLVSHAERAVSRRQADGAALAGCASRTIRSRARYAARAPRWRPSPIERALEVVQGLPDIASPPAHDGRRRRADGLRESRRRTESLRRTRDGLHAIVRAFEVASAGEQRCVFVRGEPRSGKSALVGRALAKIRGDRHVIEGQSLEGFGIGTPYLPLLEALLGLAQSSGAVAEELMATIERVAPSWIALLPTLFVARPLRSGSARAESSPAQMARELIDLVESIARAARRSSSCSKICIGRIPRPSRSSRP